MASGESKLLGELIEWLQGLKGADGKTAEAFAEELVAYRSDLERRDAAEETAYAKGLEQGEARAWNAMRNFVALRGADTRLTSADLMDRLADKLRAASGDVESADKNVDDVARVLKRHVKEQFK